MGAISGFARILPHRRFLRLHRAPADVGACLLPGCLTWWRRGVTTSAPGRGSCCPGAPRGRNPLLRKKQPPPRSVSFLACTELGCDPPHRKTLSTKSSHGVANHHCLILPPICALLGVSCIPVLVTLCLGNFPPSSVVRVYMF